MTTSSKKPKTKHLVPIGTHVPMATKVAVQAIADSKNISVYEFLQRIIQREVDSFEFEIDKLKSKGKKQENSNGEDLLA